MKKILVLDDDLDIHSFIADDFKDLDYNIDFCSTCKEAIELLTENIYFCAFIDIFLENSQTSEPVIEYIKQDKAALNQHLPVVIMSAKITKERAHSFHVKGPNVVAAIVKPFSSGDLLNIISGKKEKSILLIDDDPDIHSFMKSQLLKENYRVYSTMTAHHGIAFLENMDFETTFVDQQLNDVATGKEIVEYINENYADKKHKFKLISSSSDIHDSKIDGLETIQKPIMPKQLKQILSETNTIEEEVITISDVNEETSESTLVRGSKLDNKEEKRVIKGQNDDLDDEVTTVKGTETKEDKHVTTIKGEKEELKEENLIIKGNKEESSDDRLEVKTLKQDNSHNNLENLINVDDVNQRNKQGLTPLMIFSFMGNLEYVNKVLLKGADHTLKSPQGKTALHLGARSGNIEVVQKLINLGSKINARDNNQCEPIYDAILSKNSEMVGLFLDNGSRNNTKVNGQNYLSIAVKMNSPSIVEVLCQSGLDPLKKEMGQDSPVELAQKKSLKECFQVMKSFIK